MRDDDDEPEELGRVFYSGMRPDAERAEYALPRGVPALQDGDVEFEAGSWRERISRRKAIAVGLGVCGLVSITGFLVWPGSSDSEAGAPRGRRRFPTEPTKRPDWVEHLIKGSLQAADGPMEDLVLGYPTFLMVVRTYGEDDPKLWQGMDRLAKFAVLDRSEKGYKIATRILASFEINPPPPHFAYLTADLQDLVRRWETTRGK